jgi:hypothetical protein
MPQSAHLRQSQLASFAVAVLTAACASVPSVNQAIQEPETPHVVSGRFTTSWMPK